MIKNLSFILNKTFITNNIITKNFARKKIKKKEKIVDSKKILAGQDSKVIKLSAKGAKAKSNEELLKEREENLSLLKNFHISCEQKISSQDVIDINNYKSKNIFNLAEEPQVINDKFKEILKNNAALKIKNDFEKLPNDINSFVKKEGNRLKKKVNIPFGNYEDKFNKDLKIQNYETENYLSKRIGLMGYKVGMMSLYDNWGIYVPVTVVHVDRNQIIQKREREFDEHINIQVGSGSKSLKRIKKPIIGHFLKNNIPPKLNIMDFKVDKENILPTGYMLGVRHFTIGQLIDVRGTTKCKGVQGVMKKWGFKGQPASHGCSLSHRKGGSIGNCQDPGRVWKGKKMAGRMGNKLKWQRNLKVYRIDWERSLLYIKGSIPGKVGSLIVMKDAIFGAKKNIGLINYPTFVKKEDEHYANVVQALEDFDDPNERWEHENMLPKQILKEDEN